MNLFLKFANIRAAHAEIDKLTARISEMESASAVITEQRDAALAAVNAAHSTVESEKARATELSELLASAHAEAKTAEERAAEIVASQGVAMDKLPKDAPEAGARKTLSREEWAKLNPAESLAFVRGGGAVTN